MMFDSAYLAQSAIALFSVVAFALPCTLKTGFEQPRIGAPPYSF